VRLSRHGRFERARRECPARCMRERRPPTGIRSPWTKKCATGNGCVTRAIERRIGRSEGVCCGGRCERVHVRVRVWRQDTRNAAAFQEGRAEVFASASFSPRTLTRRAQGEFVEGRASPRDGWIRRRICRDDSSGMRTEGCKVARDSNEAYLYARS